MSAPVLLTTRLPADARGVSVGDDAVFVTTSGGPLMRVSRNVGAITTLATVCGGDNVVSDGREAFVLDVRARRITRENASGPRVLVEDVALSGVGELDGTHLFFTTVDTLFRLARDGGEPQALAKGDAPALLGVYGDEVLFTLGSFFEAETQVAAMPRAGGQGRLLPITGIAPGCVRLSAEGLLTLDAEHVLRLHRVQGPAKPEVLARCLAWPEYAERARRRPFLAATRRHLHFAGAGTLHRWPLTGGAVETHAARGIGHSAWGHDAFAWLSTGDAGVSLHEWR